MATTLEGGATIWSLTEGLSFGVGGTQVDGRSRGVQPRWSDHRWRGRADGKVLHGIYQESGGMSDSMTSRPPRRWLSALVGFSPSGPAGMCSLGCPAAALHALAGSPGCGQRSRLQSRRITLGVGKSRPDGDRLELPSGRSSGRSRDTTDDVLAVAYSPDGKTIATGSRDSTIRLWRPTPGSC